MLQGARQTAGIFQGCACTKAERALASNNYRITNPWFVCVCVCVHACSTSSAECDGFYVKHNWVIRHMHAISIHTFDAIGMQCLAQDGRAKQDTHSQRH